MATTRMIPMHLTKRKPIKQCLSERLDYEKNSDKTENSKLVSAYARDPATADADFALSKLEHKNAARTAHTNAGRMRAETK